MTARIYAALHTWGKRMCMLSSRINEANPRCLGSVGARLRNNQEDQQLWQLVMVFYGAEQWVLFLQAKKAFEFGYQIPGVRRLVFDYLMTRSYQLYPSCVYHDDVCYLG